ncbi:MAG: hypothetical protein ACI33J_05615 [Clostridium sp.]
MTKIKLMLKILLCSTLISVFFVSTIFLSDIISIINLMIAIIYSAIGAFMYFSMLISDKRKIILIKWIFSLPISFFYLQYFWKTHYAIRALNWIIPSYGRQSAGGSFSGFVLIIIFSVLCLVGIIASGFIKPKDYSKYEKIQLIVGTVVGITIFFAVIFLEKQFPSYYNVMINIIS